MCIIKIEPSSSLTKKKLKGIALLVADPTRANSTTHNDKGVAVIPDP